MNDKKKIKFTPRERGPMGNFEKPKDFKGSIIKLFNYTEKYRILIIICILLSSFSAILSIIAPKRLTILTDTITKGITLNIDEDKMIEIYNDPEISYIDKNKLTNILNDSKNSNNNMSSYINEIPQSVLKKYEPKIDLERVKNISIILGIIYISSALFNFIQSFIMVRVSNKFAYDLRKKISHKVNTLPLKYYDNNSLGDILSRVTNDVDSINMSIHNSLTTLVSALTLLIGSLIMMFYTNYILAFTALIGSFLGFIFMGIILKVSQKYFKMRQDELGKINGHIEEIYTNHNIVKIYNGIDESKKKFNKLNKRVFNANLKSQFLSGLMPPVMGFVGDLSYVLVCVVGSYLTLKGNISFGVIIAFIVYIRLFTNPLRQIASGISQLQSAAASSERVFEFLESEDMTSEENLSTKIDINNIKGNIEFKHVKFGYNKDKTIIKDFSIKVKDGSKVAIVGLTGSGKTTLVNLLMKFYDIDSGDIIIDGISIKDIKREDVHKLFIMVLQDTWLFNGTIRDNIKYNSKSSDKELLAASKVVGLDHFINSLPNGLDSELSDSDIISSGQKQLLTIARGMIKDAPFLILDEATSNVDTRTEELVSMAMDALTSGRTSFIIAHRLSTIKNADVILVVKDGNIIESGTHKQLMKLNGFYADLYNSQFSLSK